MPASRVHAVTSDGVRGHLADVQAEISPGPGSVTFSGLPGTVLSETRDRIRAAIINTGRPWPGHNLTIRVLPPLGPAGICGLDLALAVAVLTAAAHPGWPPPEDTALVGELGLDGGLRPVPHPLPAVRAAADAGLSRVIVPDSSAEAAQLPGIQVTSAPNLMTVLHIIAGQRIPDAMALDRIAEVLRDPDWAPGMLEDIAELITHTGRSIGNQPDVRWTRH